MYLNSAPLQTWIEMEVTSSFHEDISVPGCLNSNSYSFIEQRLALAEIHIFIILQIYYSIAIRRKMLHLYHDNFPKSLNEPLAMTEFYDQRSNEHQGYSIMLH